MRNKKELFKEINRQIEKDKEKIEKTRSNFKFNLYKIIELIEKTEEELKEKEEKILKNSKYKKLGSYEIKMIKINNPELEQEVKEYSSLKTKLGRLEGIKEKVESGEDYNNYYINKNGGAYVKGFQFPSSAPDDVFHIIYPDGKHGNYNTLELVSLPYFFTCYAQGEFIQECYIVESEKDRERIRKIAYIIKSINKLMRDTHGYPSLNVNIGFSYLFLGNKAYIQRSRLKDISELECKLSKYNKNESELEKVKMDFECLKYLDELIVKIFGKYNLVYQKTTKTGAAITVPF